MPEKPMKLYEEIAAKMLDKIHSGELRAGDRLPSERTLAEQYGVSRTAIREALRSLEMMGCVSSRVGEGTYIKSPKMSDIVDPFAMMISGNTRLNEELIETRLILETEIAVLAARRRTEEQLQALEETLLDMRGDLSRGGMGVDADNRFHALLAKAAGNSALATIQEMCSGMLSRTRPITQSVKGVPEQTLEDHTLICAAIRAQDEKEARKLMRRHLNRAMKNLTRAK